MPETKRTEENKGNKVFVLFVCFCEQFGTLGRSHPSPSFPLPVDGRGRLDLGPTQKKRGRLKPTILLVEDDKNDVFLMERALGKASVPTKVRVARDGREALRYLRGEGEYADRKQHPWPSLTLLDLNLPHVPGLEVLKQIRADPRLRKLIVVVLTSSVADSDIEQAYDLGANSYVSKPNNLEEGQELAELLGRYWLNKNRPASSALPE
jgi:CheY-like chemotaxis protein